MEKVYGRTNAIKKDMVSGFCPGCMAMEFVAGLPEDQRPETTEGYEGYYFAESLIGTVEGAELHCLIRDHDRDSFAKRKDFMQGLADGMNRRYGDGAVELTITDSYYNMRGSRLAYGS